MPLKRGYQLREVIFGNEPWRDATEAETLLLDEVNFGPLERLKLVADDHIRITFGDERIFFLRYKPEEL